MDRHSLVPIVFPDPITRLDTLSSAVLLWFDNPLWLLVPPVALVQDAYALLPYVEARPSEWQRRFITAFLHWQSFKERSGNTYALLKTLGEATKTMYLSYPATRRIIEENRTYAQEANLTLAAVAPQDVDGIVGDAMRYLLTDVWGEFDGHIDAVYQYVAEQFATEASTESLFVSSYLARVRVLLDEPDIPSAAILLTNERLIPLIEDGEPIGTGSGRNAVAWEVFRQLVGAQMDPLTPTKLPFIAELQADRFAELEALRVQCERLAASVSPNTSLPTIKDEVERLIRLEVADSLAALFRLNQRAIHAFFDQTFADEKTWMATLAGLVGLVSGEAHLTLAGAIGAASVIGAKATDAARASRKERASSPYRVLYRMRQLEQ